MIGYRVFGLPLHPLVVHLVVVLVPVACALVLAAAVNQRARARLGLAPLIAAGAALVLIPVAVHSGQQLQARLPDTAAIRRHAHLANGLLLWVALLVVAAALLAWFTPTAPLRPPMPPTRKGQAPPPRTHVPQRVSAAVAIVAVGLTIVQVVRVGDSGARAVWTGVGVTQPTAR